MSTSTYLEETVIMYDGDELQVHTYNTKDGYQSHVLTKDDIMEFMKPSSKSLLDRLSSVYSQDKYPSHKRRKTRKNKKSNSNSNSKRKTRHRNRKS